MSVMWYLQLVQLPLIRMIGAEKFPAFYDQYKMKTTMLFFPIMTLEVFTSFAVLLSYAFQLGKVDKLENSFIVYGISFFLLLLLHLITFQFIIPLFKRLYKKFDENTCIKIVQYNYIRSIGWTVRAILILSTLFHI